MKKYLIFPDGYSPEQVISIYNELSKLGNVYVLKSNKIDLNSSRNVRKSIVRADTHCELVNLCFAVDVICSAPRNPGKTLAWFLNKEHHEFLPDDAVSDNGEVKIVALYKVWRGARFMIPSLESIYSHVEKIVIVSSEISWEGNTGNDITDLVLEWASTHDVEKKIEIVRYDTENQEKQYNAGYSHIREKHRNCNWILIIDADEVFDEEAWKRSMVHLRNAPLKLRVLRSMQHGYIKSPLYRLLANGVRPPVFVRNGVEVQGIRAQGTFPKADMEDVWVHHFSCVRDTENEVFEKLRTSTIGDGAKMTKFDQWRKEVWDALPYGKVYHYNDGADGVWNGVEIISKWDLPSVLSKDKDIAARYGHINDSIDKSIKCMTFCSSWQRPKECARMLASFYRTKGLDNEIFVYAHEDDPQIAEYKEILRGVRHIIGPHRFMCHVNNWGVTEKYPGLPFYHEANDDHVFITPGWCELLMSAIKERGNGWGIAYGVSNGLPTSTMISGNIIRELGYWTPPEFQHYYVDNFIKEFGQAIGRIFHVPEVNIEHRHRLWGKAADDGTYQWVYSARQQDIGVKAYEEWIKNRKMQDINKILAKIGEQKNE